jgi:hypothetical protein
MVDGLLTRHSERDCLIPTAHMVSRLVPRPQSMFKTFRWSLMIPSDLRIGPRMVRASPTTTGPRHHSLPARGRAPPTSDPFIGSDPIGPLPAASALDAGAGITGIRAGHSGDVVEQACTWCAAFYDVA